MSQTHRHQHAIDGGRFLSLKWKIILLLSFVLLLVNGLLAWWSYQNLISDFEERRSVIRKRLLDEALSLQHESAQRMQRLAYMMASIANTSGYSDTGDGLQAVMGTFDTYWSSLQMNQGVDALRLYGKDGRTLFVFGSEQAGSAKESSGVAHVLESEEPVSWLDCEQECYQSALAPILAHGRVAGAVAVNGLVDDMIVSFYQLTEVHIALLAPSALTDGPRVLPALAMRVVGLSGGLPGMEANLPVLKEIARLPLGNDGRGWQTVHKGGRYYDLSFVRVGMPYGKQASPILVVLEDVSKEYADIRNQALWHLGGNIAASLVALLLLVVLLNSILGRMTRTALAIPLLGQHDFSEVRARLQQRSTIVLWDEVDSLDSAAVTLSYRLEELEKEARAHAEQMSDAMRRISIERDFNLSLLDTAQVVILTQTNGGDILTINRYGENLSGWNEEELRGQNFFRTICRTKSDENDMMQVLQEVADGRQDNLTHECILVNRNGGEKVIVWNHTQLIGDDGETVQVLSVGVDITDRKRAEDDLAYLANHDPLTDLVNRKHFQEKLQEVLDMSRRHGRSGALLYLDLDGFKYVNDVSGHKAGDDLLQLVAQELVGATRVIDLVGRLGGDEMGILLQECDANGAVVVAEKIIQRLEGLKLPGYSHRVSASIGIVMFPAGDADVKQLLANADIAMYQAKAAGRARWHLYAEGERLQEKLHRWVHWEERIKKALDEDGFVMHYQPILDIHASRISHYEALVRMRAEDGSLVAPGEFMEVAEQSGLIRQIDRLVVKTVIDRMSQLLKQGETYKFAINLSGHSINDDSLLVFLRQILASHPELPQHLIFEITETAAVSDFTAARSFMQAVHELGCMFSLDDFGVGFSSFYYVKHLPVDYVKIDGSFVRNLADSPDDQVFVRALAEVARGFGKKTVAEFVESNRTLALLRAFGVDYAQGYFIGRPSEVIKG